jgi:hypothetical protein
VGVSLGSTDRTRIHAVGVHEAFPPPKMQERISSGKLMVMCFGIWNEKGLQEKSIRKQSESRKLPYSKTGSTTAIKRSCCFMTIAEFTAHQVREVIDECDFVKMKHPPLSADLPPNDYYLFPKLKKHLRGRRFSLGWKLERSGREIFWGVIKGFFFKAYPYWKNVGIDV